MRLDIFSVIQRSYVKFNDYVTSNIKENIDVKLYFCLVITL
jgi:hypothetical protein